MPRTTASTDDTVTPKKRTRSPRKTTGEKKTVSGSTAARSNTRRRTTRSSTATNSSATTRKRSSPRTVVAKTTSKRSSSQKASSTRRSTTKKNTAKKIADPKTVTTTEAEVAATDRSPSQAEKDIDTTPVRRAPTTAESSRIGETGSFWRVVWRLLCRVPWPHWVMLCLATTLFGTSVYLGVSDPGEINVQGVANERTETGSGGEQSTERVTVPVQNSEDRPRLRPSSQGRSTPAPAAAVATSTATSTASTTVPVTASSTATSTVDAVVATSTATATAE